METSRSIKICHIGEYQMLQEKHLFFPEVKERADLTRNCGKLKNVPLFWFNVRERPNIWFSLSIKCSKPVLWTRELNFQRSRKKCIYLQISAISKNQFVSLLFLRQNQAKYEHHTLIFWPTKARAFRKRHLKTYFSVTGLSYGYKCLNSFKVIFWRTFICSQNASVE